MFRRKLGILLTVALVGGLLAFGAVPSAHAAAPFNIQQFHPRGPTTPIFGTELGDVLSDKFDGVDSLAHLTAVTSTDAQSVTWYACPTGTALTNAGLSTCNVTIGTDSTGVVPPVGNSPSSPASEAFDVTWDIPGSLDLQVRDIIAVACIGSGVNLDAPSPNCKADSQHNVTLEDAQTGGAANQTTAGEIGPYRTLPTCLGQGNTAIHVPFTDTACDPAFKPFPHGSPVPSDGFDFQAFTSNVPGTPEVGNLEWRINSPSSASVAPGTANSFSSGTCANNGNFTNFTRWYCSLSDANVPNNAEMALSIVDVTGAGAANTKGFCSSASGVASAHNNCVLDTHYLVSSDRVPTKVVQSFVPTGDHSHSPPSPPAGSGCRAGETPVKTHANTSLGNDELVMICITDQFTDPMNNQNFTEEASAPADFELGGGCTTVHDHNGDGSNEHCHGTTGVDGSATAEVENFGAVPGTATITSCWEGQPLSTATGHGCANEAANLKDQVTLSWSTTPVNVIAAWGNLTGNCAAGRSSITMKKGNLYQATFCTTDAAGNPVGTDVDSSFIQAFIIGAQGGERTAFKFDPPTTPTETTTPGGVVHVTVRAIRAGINELHVILHRASGAGNDEYFIQGQVKAPPNPHPCAGLHGKKLKKCRKAHGL